MQGMDETVVTLITPGGKEVDVYLAEWFPLDAAGQQLAFDIATVKCAENLGYSPFDYEGFELAGVRHSG